MSAWSEVQLGVDALGPHVIAVALISSRLLPIAFLCPLFGGSHSPTHVKLGLVLTLALFLHVAAGVTVPVAVSSPIEYAGMAVREVILGVTLGLVASLPFDMVRIGGRFIDVFRGSSAEAALPLMGSKEAASGDLLYHLALALAASGVAMPMWLSSLTRTFGIVGIGAFTAHENVAMHVTTLVGTAFATGLAIGAPIAAASLCIDALVGLAARAAPSMNLPEVGTPLRILGGGIVMWTAFGLIAERFLAVSAGTTDAIRLLMELGIG